MVFFCDFCDFCGFLRFLRFHFLHRKNTVLDSEFLFIKKLSLLSNDITHSFLIVNPFRTLSELLKNAPEIRKTHFLVWKTRTFFIFSERQKCIKKTFFVLLSFEGSFFRFIPARENRKFLISMLVQSWGRYCKKIAKIAKIAKKKTKIQNTKPFFFHTIKCSLIWEVYLIMMDHLWYIRALRRSVSSVWKILPQKSQKSQKSRKSQKSQKSQITVNW